MERMPSSSSDNSNSNHHHHHPTVDTTVLRNVLRLIHCLQKERGATCAYTAASTTTAATSTTSSNNNINGQQQHQQQNDASKDGFVEDHNQQQQQQGSNEKGSKRIRKKERRVLLQAAAALSPARADTDRAFVKLLKHRPIGTTILTSRMTLEKLRNTIPVIVGTKKNDIDPLLLSPPPSKNRTTSASGFHRILVCYNTLIQSIVHDHILRHTNIDGYARRDNVWFPSLVLSQTPPYRRRRTRNPFKTYDNGLPRSQSHQLFSNLASSLASSPSSHQPLGLSRRSNVVVPSSYPDQPSIDHRFLAMEPPLTLPSHPVTMHQEVPSGTDTDSDGYDHYDIENATDAVVDGDGHRATNLSSPNDESSSDDSSLDDEYKTPTSDDDDSKTKTLSKLIRLLQLLESFVRLKESTGVERATLCSILAAGRIESRILLNDLVMEAENHRQHLDRLQNQLMVPSSSASRVVDRILHNLIQEMVAMSPAMEQLQNSILQGFDLSALKAEYQDDSTKLWNLLTLYIDKLHSLELLIVEEIECCCDDNDDHTTNSGKLDVKSGSINRSSSAMKQVNESTGNTITESSERDVHQGVLKERDKITPTTKDEVNGYNLLESTFGVDSNDPDLYKILHRLTPDEIKRKLLDAVNDAQKNQQRTQQSSTVIADGNVDKTKIVEAQEKFTMPPTSKAVEDLLHELSCAPASKEWEIDLYEIQFRKRIGQGAAGTTYLADWSALPVAVKVASINEMGLDGWRTEVQALQKLHHPNIIRLLGSVYHPNPLTFCLVLEYCDSGDLSSALLKVTPRNFFFEVAYGVTKGMSYLHRRGVIHRDIKPSNILLHGNVSSGQFQVKVTDFGVATDTSSMRGNRTAETGTYRWMAPEVIRHENYSQPADVYSFAVVMWQLLTREEPFQDRGQIEAAAAVAIEMTRPPLPDNTPTSIRQIIVSSWDGEPSKRLPFDKIVGELNQIEKSLTTDEMNWLEAPLGHWVYKKKTIKPNAFDDEYAGGVMIQPPQSGNDQQQRNPIPHHHPKKKGSGLRTLFARTKKH